MKHAFFKLVSVVFIAVMFNQCQKERDAYYEAPEWIGKSVFETLQDEGRFDLYLQLAEKTEYSISLKGNGFWTVFAPNNAAVTEWLSEKGYTSVDDVSVAEAASIVSYSLLFNQYRFEELSHVLNNGWDSLASVKKRTTYYETIHKELYKGDSIWVISPIFPRIISTADMNDNNYKYIPFYMKEQLAKQSLTERDYNLFYPNSRYTGRNVQRASVLQENIFTSNGVIHEVDKVNEPLPNFEKILSENPDYSKYWDLIQMKDKDDEPYFYYYVHQPQLTTYFQKMYPSMNIDRVHVKIYYVYVGIDCERYSSLRSSGSDNHPEKGGYTLFAPNNAGVDKFYNEKLSDYYSSIDNVPYDVWHYFINAQMCDGLIYPGLYHRLENVFQDYINGSGFYGPRFTDVSNLYTDIRPASNGFFYGGNNYIKNNFFESVITEVRFNSRYSFMWRAFDFYFYTSLLNEITKSELNGYPDEDYSLLLIQDELFRREASDYNAGFTWAWAGENTNDMRYQFDHTWGTAFARERMQRLVRSHIFKRTKETSLNGNANKDFFKYGDPDYGGAGYALNEYGDMVRYRNGELQMIGNYDKNEWVKVEKHKTFLNGTVYTIDKLLQYGRCPDDPFSATITCNGKPMLDYLQEAARQNPNVSKSVAYLKALIEHLYIEFEFPENNSSYFTVLLPSNTAIDAAIAAGHLRTLASNGTIQQGDDPIIEKFFKYHVIVGQVFIDDGIETNLMMSTGEIKKEHRALTMHKIGLTSTYVNVKKTDKRLTFSNTGFVSERKDALVTPGFTRSNQFAPKGVIHELNDYLIPPLEL